MNSRSPGRRTRPFAAALTLCLLPALAAPLAGAGPSPQQDGATPTVREGVFSQAQAERGASRFKEACASCHNIAELGGARFRNAWKDQSLGDLFDFLVNAMPQGDPGSLTPDEYTSLIAYILSQSGYPAGSRELPSGKAPLSAYKLLPLP